MLDGSFSKIPTSQHNIVNRYVMIDIWTDSTSCTIAATRMAYVKRQILASEQATWALGYLSSAIDSDKIVGIGMYVICGEDVAL